MINNQTVGRHSRTTIGDLIMRHGEPEALTTDRRDLTRKKSNDNVTRRCMRTVLHRGQLSSARPNNVNFNQYRVKVKARSVDGVA
jgi:hypothetical protein